MKNIKFEFFILIYANKLRLDRSHSQRSMQSLRINSYKQTGRQRGVKNIYKQSTQNTHTTILSVLLWSWFCYSGVMEWRAYKTKAKEKKEIARRIVVILTIRASMC